MRSESGQSDCTKVWPTPGFLGGRCVDSPPKVHVRGAPVIEFIQSDIVRCERHTPMHKKSLPFRPPCGSLIWNLIRRCCAETRHGSRVDFFTGRTETTEGFFCWYVVDVARTANTSRYGFDTVPPRRNAP